MYRLIEEVGDFIADHGVEVLAPGPSHTGGPNDILEDKVPANNEGPQFTDCHVTVDVGWARFGNTRPKFGIAQAWEEPQ